MAYQSTIPLATDQLSVSQGDIQGNFIALGVIAGNGNAGSASLNATVGFNFLNMAVQGANPGFAAGRIGLYSLNNANTTQNELYINKTNFAGVAQIPSTASILGSATPAALSAGWTYLPSGLILKWSGNVVANGQTTINFPVNANTPVFTTCLNVFLVVADGTIGVDVDKAIRLTGVFPASFGVYASSRVTVGAAPVAFSYFAIGY